jgi:3-phenylpropionate/trans-cinnamate dioxygenase ferredoxin component
MAKARTNRFATGVTWTSIMPAVQKEKRSEIMSLVEVGQVNDVPQGTMKSFLAGTKRVLVSNIEGKFYAINNTCTHMGGDLSKGKLEGKVVTCPRHGSKFDVTTGKSISGPRMGFLKFNTKDEPVFEVKVEDNKIKIAVD